MGYNDDNIPTIKDHPSTEIVLNNTVLSCENCNLVRAEGLISLRPRKEARFICLYCLQLHVDKIKDMKK